MRASLCFAAATLSVAAFAFPLQAQAVPSIGLGPVAGTYGLGGELALRPHRLLGVRAGAYFLSLTRREPIEDLEYDLTGRLRNAKVSIDLHPFGSAFRLTGGAVLSGTRVDGTAILTTSVEIGDRVYTPEQVGHLDVRVDWRRSLWPYLGLGFTGNGKVGLIFDLGVAFAGHPRLGLAANSPLTGPERAEFDAELAKEVAEAQAEVDREELLRYFPYLALGLRFRF